MAPWIRATGPAALGAIRSHIASTPADPEHPGHVGSPGASGGRDAVDPVSRDTAQADSYLTRLSMDVPHSDRHTLEQRQVQANGDFRE